MRQELRQVGDFVGSMLIALAEPDYTMFTDDELKVLDTICTHFSKMTSREISRISHDEDAWLNHHDKHECIPFDDAFTIKAI